MPKERRQRVSTHAKSVRLTKRRLTDQANTLEQPVIEDVVEPSVSNPLPPAKLDEREAYLTKKEKQHLKRELFLQRLETGSAPYSKSHARRLKRKSREKIAGGLDELHAAIVSVEEEIPVAVKNSIQDTTKDGSSSDPPAKAKPQLGQIGKGKTLSQSQRKTVLRVEQIRHPLILSNPDYISNPFETIRKHAQNTLVKR
ncbi:hypothetical protein NEOLEDRAFT_1082524 [Neolentinus lepideus HHB14362 ss-1]|uniref:Ribosome biogenesis protein SLX9 n=1 Tax=Neolentinus lepideus HHB14362 ss-1 TaxID=1314782 RepID=A0A165W145_9AGAM|nr:hypothetical protein NEOLEDRAFT_1082524 [Neolentinus lepideus HHB14362 ss-1]